MVTRYTAEFKADVVAIARKSESTLRQIAKDFGIGKSALHAWLAATDSGTVTRVPVSVTSESNVLRELRKRNKLLEQEAEVMRRAVAYLSEGVNSYFSSPQK